ncbi:MAG: hypothetical protein Q6K35_11450, partial [Thermostichus sp. DG02_4_bins_136]
MTQEIPFGSKLSRLLVEARGQVMQGSHTVGSIPEEKSSLAEFRVGVDAVIFSIDTERNRLLVLLVRRREEPFR